MLGILAFLTAALAALQAKTEKAEAKYGVSKRVGWDHSL